MKNIARLFAVMALLMIGVNNSRLLAAVLIDNIYYEIDSTGTSAYVRQSVNTIETANILDVVNIDGKDYPVTSIGSSAFTLRKNLTSVNIGQNIATIGESAFAYCSLLPSVALPAGLKSVGNYAFAECTSLSSVVIPDGVTSLGEYAFANCSKLETVVLPSYLTSLGLSAFTNCSSLKSIDIPGSLTTISAMAFEGCSSLASVTLNEGLQAIETGVFRNCMALESITFPESFASIGNEVFTGCTSLLSVTMKGSTPPVPPSEYWGTFSGETVKSGVLTVPAGSKEAYQASRVWGGFANIIEEGVAVEIVDGLRFVKDAIYYKVVSAADKTVEVTFGGETYNEVNDEYSGEVVVPQTVNYEDIDFKVVSIGNTAFTACENLKSVTISSNVKTIGNAAFEGCSKLSAVTIPNSVTSIGDEAFFECYGLTSVTIPNSVTSIGDEAFFECYGLTSVTIPNSVTSIGDYTFSFCSGLTSVTIPNSVTSIGEGAFFGCNSLASIILEGGTPPEAHDDPFNTYETTVLIVPVGAKSAYQSADVWKNFATIREVGEGEIKDGDKFEKDGMFYTIISVEDKTVEVTFKGETYNEVNNEYSGEVIVPQTVNFDDIDFKVVGIGDGTFIDCKLLKSIILPSSVTRIGNCAFGDCSGLTSIEIPKGITEIGSEAFSGCSGLTSIELPESVISIGDAAFGYCSALTSVKLSEGVISIGRCAFSECSALTSIEIPSSVTRIGDMAFYRCSGLTSIKIPEGVTIIDERTFFGCIGLESVIIPSSVTSIGEYAFFECSALKSIEIPENVTSIGGHVFFGCKLLKSIVLPSSVTSIGGFAFHSCSGLTSIEIPAKVTSIGTRAFGYCYSLESVVVAEGNEVYDSRENCNAIIETKTNNLILGCKTTTIPSSVTSIGEVSFYGCLGLTSIELPESVTSIGGEAFYGCSGLASINIKQITPPTAYDTSFDTYETTVLTVPVGAKSAYQSANVWKNFATIREVGEGEIKDGDKFEKDGIFYTILSVEDKTVEVTFKGETYYEVKNEYSGEVVVPQTVNYEEIDFKVVSIGIRAFAACENLNSVNIPEGVTSIGGVAFCLCSGLTSVTIPNSVTSIGDITFYYCSGLTSVTIPNSVTSIGINAFAGCSSLESVNMKGSTPPTAYDTSFDTYETTVLTVPVGAKSAYQSADVWKKFATIREEGEGEFKDGDKFETDGIYYKIVSAKDKTVEVTFKGETYDEVDNEYQGDVVIPQTVSYEDVDFTVVGVGEKALYGCDNIRRLSVPLTVSYFDKGAINSETLRELYWNSTMAFSKSVFVNPDAATNMILYITAETACDYDGNVVRDGVAEEIFLTDALPLQITTGFKAKRISYNRHFDKVTVPRKPGGWESIVLPFDVQSFVSEEAGEIAPFNSGNAGAKPFMLAQMTAGGFAVATKMKANVPYILVMPNSEVYGDDENISGNVMFCAESAGGVAVKPTVEAVKAEGSEFDLVPSYEGEVRDFSVYALNEMSYNDMLPGSAFVSGLREVKPFEAYASVDSKPANAKTHFVIGGNGTATDIQRLYDRLFEGLEVESREGVLYIHSAEAQKVGLYSSDGRLVRIVYLNKGVNTVGGLAKGIYMVGTKKVAMK